MTNAAAARGCSPAVRVTTAQIAAALEQRQVQMPPVPRPAQLRAVRTDGCTPRRPIITLERAQTRPDNPAGWIPATLVPDTPCRLAQRSGINGCAHGLYPSSEIVEVAAAPRHWE